MSDTPHDIPSNWTWKPIGEVATVNPRLDRDEIEGDTQVSFVPMKRVEELTGRIDLSESRPIDDVATRYTYFAEGDVIFAKITPCMENGKTAIARGLENGIGFGSTEFHVVRASNDLLEKWVFYYLIQEGFRRDAKRVMTGSAGQKRVPTRHMKQASIPVPPLAEQRRIVAKIEELLTDLDAGVADLERTQRQLHRYRRSVLAAAVSGRLTAAWRASHADAEPAEALLERILDERRRQWEADYRWKRYDSKGKEPPNGWKGRYTEPEPAGDSGTLNLPESWKRVRFEHVALLDSGYAFKSKSFVDQGMPLLRGANVAPGHLKWEETRYWPEDELSSYKHLVVEEGDVILAMDRPLISDGLKIARASKADTPCLLVQRVARFKPVVDAMTPFVYIVCQTHNFIEHLLEGQTGTQLPHVSKKSIRAFPVPLPPLEEQRQIVSETERLLSVADEAARTVEREMARAERLRQSILKEAFAGRLVASGGNAAGGGDAERSNARKRGAAAQWAGKESTQIEMTFGDSLA